MPIPAGHASFITSYQQLLCAARAGGADHVKQLCREGVFPEASSGPDGYTALHAAAEAGDVWAVPLLVAAGFDPNARTSDGRTPLALAAIRRDVDVVAALVACGASTQAADSRGDTPLHMAAGWAIVSMTQALLAAGANARAANNRGCTALHMVCYGDVPRPWLPVALPFDSTLDLHVTDADRVEVAQALLEAGAAVGAQTALCETPLLIAACFGHQPLIEVLLSHGAVPTLPDKRGWTPLYTACWHNQPGVVSRLLQLVEVQQQLEAATSDGWTALVAASWHGHDRVVPLLLAAGADVQSLSPRGLRPLHAAGTRNHLSVLSMLLAAVADPCAVDGKHQSMLHLAAAWGQQDVLEVLLAALAAGKGSSSSSSSMEAMVHGRTALHWAVEKKQTSCVEMLLAAGANPDVLYGEGGRDRDGSIAGLSTLFAAVRVGHAAAIQLLATPHLLRQTWQGQTPLHRALYEGKADIAQLLIAAGSPAGVPDAAGATAMSLASASIDPALRRLLPAMMRGECELQLQVLQKQQQQHKVGEGGRAAVPAALVDMLYGLVETAWLVTNHWQAVCCIDMVLEVLGPPAATRMLRQVLQRCTRFSSQADARNSAMELLRLTHTGWLQTMEPLLRQRQTVTNRLQYLVTQPLQQQRRRRRRAAAAGALQQARLCEQLQSDVLAACDAGQWGLLVQRMEQLAGLQLCQYKQYFERAVAAHVRKKHAANRRAVMGLCEVLLESWAAAQRELAAGRELVDAVVCAVQAREAQHVMVGSSSWLSRMLPQKCGAGAWRTAASSVLAWCSSLPSSLWFPCWRR